MPHQSLIRCVLVLLMLLSLPGFAATSRISREAMQSYMKQPGNASLDRQWIAQYLNRSVQWQGQIYDVYYRSGVYPVEVMVKVIPSSHLYDTVLLLPPDHPMLPQLKRGQRVQFEGTVTRVVDTPLVKEVQVEFRDGEIGRLMILPEPSEQRQDLTVDRHLNRDPI